MIRHLGMLQVESRIKVEIERNMNEGEDLPRPAKPSLPGSMYFGFAADQVPMHPQ
jgi:hypothetical protein